MKVLVDRPEVIKGITRVSGPFVVEATIPAAADLGELEAEAKRALRTESAPAPYVTDVQTHIERMVEVLRQSKTLCLPGNRMLNFVEVRRLSDAEWLHAEATEKNGGDGRVAIVFGPESGTITSNIVLDLRFLSVGTRKANSSVPTGG
jgi:adenine-specific DNA-methyltransferase